MSIRVVLVTAAFGCSLLSLGARPARTAAPAADLPGTFANPPVLRDENPDPGVVEVTLTASPVRATLLPGAPAAEFYGYNGGTPGPTLEVREGDRVRVHFRNRLPDTTTVHWHGLHIPFEADGSPFHPVAPGQDYTYDFTVRPGAAGTYWYHP